MVIVLSLPLSSLRPFCIDSCPLYRRVNSWPSVAYLLLVQSLFDYESVAGLASHSIGAMECLDTQWRLY